MTSVADAAVKTEAPSLVWTSYWLATLPNCSHACSSWKMPGVSFPRVADCCHKNLQQVLPSYISLVMRLCHSFHQELGGHSLN